MPVKQVIHTSTRERKANYGDSARTQGGSSPLFSLHMEQATPLLLTVECTEIAIGVGPKPGDFRPMVHVKWGHGASSVETDVDVTFRQRFAMVASSIDVDCFIGAFVFPGQTAPAPPVPPGSHANFRAFVGEGLDGLRPFATQWATQLNVSTGVLSTTQCRLASLRAFKPGGNAVEYLLLFDQTTPPALGDVPMDGAPLPTANNTIGGLVPIPMGETRGFVRGLTWGMSSTPFSYTATNTAIFLSAEFEQ